MPPPPLAIHTLACAGLTWLAVTSSPAQTSSPDPRNFANGRKIPAQNYCDQPRVVVTRDGTWICLLTTGPGAEGAPGQHVVATASSDGGKNWSPLVDVEPPDPQRSSAYALAFLTPADRIYAFYDYNGDAVRTTPGGQPVREDMQGWFCYRYSDDKGRTWSKRFRLPLPPCAADRGNDWQGRVQMFWAVGTPGVFNGRLIFGFTRLGKYLLENGEGWFFRSDNILTELCAQDRRP